MLRVSMNRLLSLPFSNFMNDRDDVVMSMFNKQLRIAAYCITTAASSLISKLNFLSSSESAVIAPSHLCITLVCGRQDFIAVKQRLVDASPYFDALLNGHFQEKGSERIVLNNVQAWEMKIIILETHPNHRMSKGKNNWVGGLGFERQLQLLVTADMLSLCCVYEKCKEAICKAMIDLTVEQAALVWDVAERIGDSILLHAIITFAVNFEYKEGKFPVVFADAGWNQPLLLHARKKIFSNSSQELIKGYRQLSLPVNFIVSWVRHDPNRRLFHFEHQENKIPLQSIPGLYVFNQFKIGPFRNIRKVFDESFLDQSKEWFESELWNDSRTERIILGVLAVEEGTGSMFPVPMLLELGTYHQIYSLPVDDLAKHGDTLTNCQFLSLGHRLLMVCASGDGLLIADFNFIYGVWHKLGFQRDGSFVPISCAARNNHVYSLAEIRNKHHQKQQDADDAEFPVSTKSYKLFIFSLTTGSWDVVTNFFPYEFNSQCQMNLLSLESLLCVVVHLEVELMEENGDLNTFDSKMFFAYNRKTRKFVEIMTTEQMERGQRTLTASSYPNKPHYLQVASMKDFIVTLTNKVLFICEPVRKKMFVSTQGLPTYEMCRNSLSLCNNGETIWCLFNQREGLFAFQHTRQPGRLLRKKYSVRFSEYYMCFIDKNQDNLTFLCFSGFPCAY